MSNMCPATELLTLLSKKHTLLIFHNLKSSQAGLGFNEIQTKLNINTASLSKRLKELEKAGYLKKIKKGTNTTYFFTDKGLSLSKIIDSLSNFAVS